MSAHGPDDHVRSTLQGEPLPPSVFERNVSHIVKGVYVACGTLIAADLVFHFVGHKHVHFDIEAWPGFYALAGFVSYVGLVMTAKQLRKLLMRPEAYYGEETTPPITPPLDPSGKPAAAPKASPRDASARKGAEEEE